MTRQFRYIAAQCLLLISAANTDARSQDELGFELSEPQPSSALESSNPGRSDASLTIDSANNAEFGDDSTALRRKSSSASESDAGPRTTISSGIPRNTARENSAKTEHVPTVELIAEDPIAPGFFTGPVPRTEAIAEDSALNDVCSIGKECWAVGERGVICHSRDDGKSWTTRLTPMECSLRSVCFLTNNVGWVAGLRVLSGTSQQTAVLLQTRDGGQTWADLTANAQSSVSISAELHTAALPGILHAQFFGLDDAIAVTLPVQDSHGHGIFRSSNGGRTWTPVSTDRRGGPWTAAHFLDASEGIVVGLHQSYATVVSQHAVVINPPQPTLRQVRGVSLSPDGRGWIVGDGGLIMTTDNGGVSWQSPVAELPAGLSEVADLHTVVHQRNTVLIAGNPGCALLRTETAGSDWTIHSLPMTGHVSRLHVVSATVVLAVGSFGQILRSDDAGNSWQPVRSSNLRSGIMTLVTDADHAPWQLLVNGSGEAGVRSVVVQPSQPLDDNEEPVAESTAALNERSRMAVTQIGGNDTAVDWMFPRTKPEHHRSSSRLIAEWNRQSDGRLRTLLPLRIARDIRNWKPSIIVIEPASEDDAVAAIFRDVMPEALRLAASPDSDADLLAQAGMHPWTVERVYGRVPVDRTSPLSFDDTDLLPALGTSTGLLCDAASIVLRPEEAEMNVLRTRAGYEILSGRDDRIVVRSLIDGLQDALTSHARRPVQPRNQEDIDSLKRVLLTAHTEASALSGHLRLANTEDALIAELQGVGANLPEPLALKQLHDLAQLNLQQNRMEGYLAVQQEITRRVPSSEDARRAAQMLFLFYSSSESRHYRMRDAMNRTDRHRRGQAVPLTEHRTPVNPDNTIQPFNAIQPSLQSPATQAFSASAVNSVTALQERWDRNAVTSFRILTAPKSDGSQASAISPAILLRHAANLRIQQRNPEHSSILSELGKRDDEFGLFAKSEIQVVHAASTPVLPLLNLPRHSDRPFLDGVLTDGIWEDAQELPLTPYIRTAEKMGSEGFARQTSRHKSEVSSLSMLAWDEDYLYLAARLERIPLQDSPLRLATHRSHDAEHHNRDRLELEIDTDRDFTTSFQFTVDESGQTSDRCWLLDKWNPDWFVALDSDDTTWRIEAAIPLAELSAQPARPGDLWSIRLRRIIPGVLQHELQSGPNNEVSTRGTALVRFIRPKVKTPTRKK